MNVHKRHPRKSALAKGHLRTEFAPFSEDKHESFQNSYARGKRIEFIVSEVL